MQTQATEPVTGTERPPTDWQSVDWRKANKVVSNLRQRIFRATQQGDWAKVRSLQKLMLRSYSNTLVRYLLNNLGSGGGRECGGDLLGTLVRAGCQVRHNAGIEVRHNAGIE